MTNRAKLAVAFSAFAFAVLVVGVIVRVATVSAGSAGAVEPDSTPASASTSTSTPQTMTAPPVSCTAATVVVTTAKELQDALTAAAPGQTIGIAAGTYVGNFTVTTSGTAAQPITLCGAADSILDGGGIFKDYVLHLDSVSNWVLSGFTVQNGQKGVMLDKTTNSIIQNLTVTAIGDEGIHLRNFSTDNVVNANTVSKTGLRKPQFGEGIYIGTAQSNWCDVTNCDADRSDRNTVSNNVISGTTAENVDIKEGTTSGVLRGNSFDGAGITAADSWVDVKGNDWTIDQNTGVDSPKDGFQTHQILDGWGTGNTFSANQAAVNGPGVGFSLTPVLGNVVACDNTASGAALGLSNTGCS